MRLNSYGKWKNQASSLSDDYQKQGRFEEAERLLGKVLLLEPQDVDARLQFAKALLGKSEAETYRKEVLFLSLFLTQGEKAKELLEIFKQGMKFFPEDVNLLSRAAQLAAGVGEPETVETFYDSLANIYQEKALPLRAVEMYEKIITIFPEKFEYLEKIGDVYRQEGLSDQAADRYFSVSRHYLEKERFAEASIALERVLSIHPDDREAVFSLVRAYLAERRVSDAQRTVHQKIEELIGKGELEEAFSLSRRFVDFLIQKEYAQEASAEKERLASLLLSRDKPEEAYALLPEVAEEEFSRGNPEKSLDLLQKTLDFYLTRNQIPKLSEIYQRLILIAGTQEIGKARDLLEGFVKQLFRREKIRELDSALHSLAMTFELSGSFQFSEEILVRLAEIYISIYKLPKAVHIYKSLAEKNPKDPELFVRLTELYLREGEISLAKDSCRQAAELFVKSEQEGKAEEIFRLLLEKQPHDPSLPMLLASIFYRIGSWDKALAYYRISLSQNPYYRPAVLGVAKTYGKQGMPEEIVSLAKQMAAKGFVAELVEEYRSAIAEKLSPGAAALSLGTLCKELGFLEEAMIEFQKASLDSDYFLNACNELAACFKLQGFSDLAIRQYRKALESAHQYPEEKLLELRYNLAFTYEELGMTRDALELYNDILAFDIDYRDVKNRIGKLGKGEARPKVVPLTRGS